MGREATVTPAEAAGIITNGEQTTVPITRTETRLLAALVENPLAVISHEYLVKAIHPGQSIVPQDTPMINTYMSRLRGKFGDNVFHSFLKRGISLTFRLNIKPQDQTNQEELKQQEDLGVRRHFAGDYELVLDDSRCVAYVFPKKEEIILPPHESSILKAFMKDPRKVVSMDDLCQILWPDRNDQSADIASCINSDLVRLRPKIWPLKIHNMPQKGWSLTSNEEYAKALLAKMVAQDQNTKLDPDTIFFANHKGDYYLLTDRGALILPSGQVTELQPPQTEIIEILTQDPLGIFSRSFFEERGIYRESLQGLISRIRKIGLPVYCFRQKGYSLTPYIGARNGRRPFSSTIFEPFPYRP